MLEIDDAKLLIDGYFDLQITSRLSGCTDIIRIKPEWTCRNLKMSSCNYLECSLCGETSYQGDVQFNYCPSCGAKVVRDEAI